MAKIIIATKGKISKEQAMQALTKDNARYRSVNSTATVLQDLEDGAAFSATCTGEFMEMEVPGNKGEVNLFALTKEKVRFRVDADILPLLEAGTEVALMKSSVNGGMAFATFMSVTGTKDTTTIGDNTTKQTA